MRKKITFVLLALLLTACSSLPAASTRQPLVALTPCQLSSPGLTREIEAQCGSLQVYENPIAQSGRQIDLHFAVISAVSKNPAADPIFFLAGGPGEAATQSFQLVSTAFKDLNAKRDIVLVDQRGTGQSHPLNCTQAPQSAAQITAENVQEYVRACLSDLDADPRFYTTSIAMQDLDQVRQVLGYEKINLYGVSYGTRAALEYVRQYPDRVRSVILDGVAPPSWTLGERANANAQRALDLIFQRCQEDPGCAAAFPDLPQKFQTILARLEASPVQVSLPDPTSGEVITTTIDLETFTGTIFNMSYAPEMVSLIPLLVHTTYEREDYTMAAAQGLTAQSALFARISDGMRYSILCSEDEPFYQPGDSGQGYIQGAFMDPFNNVCDFWPHEQVPAAFKEPVRSDLPTLILSGEMDPVTPPANGDLAAQTLPNSLHIIVSGQGHVNMFRGCVPDLAAQFLEAASVQGLDTGCIQDIQPLPFFTSFAGPNP